MSNSPLVSAFSSYWIKSRFLRFSFRAITAIFFLRFATEALVIYFETKSINYLLLVVSELISVGLLIFARDSLNVRITALAILSTTCGTFYYLLIDFFEYSTVQLIPLEAGIFLQTTGIALQIYSKLSLGRSFGLLPANRGVVKGGAYRFVRHPIYASYMIGHVGYILGAFNFWNFIVLIIAHTFQFIRIREEEALLKKDVDYLAYSKRVKWKILPFVF